MSIETNAPKASRKTISEKKALVAQWEKSDQKMKVFCVEQGITLSSLSYWIRQFGSEGKRINKEKSFIALELEKGPSGYNFESYSFAEVLFANGTKMVIRQPVSPAFLKELLA
jgi:hypothetical protein